MAYFVGGAIIFVPVPPTLCPPDTTISLLSQHPTPTRLSLYLPPPLLPTDMHTFTKKKATNLPTPHTYYHTEEKTNESQ